MCVGNDFQLFSAQTNFTNFHDHILNFIWGPLCSNDVDSYAEYLMKTMKEFYVTCFPFFTKFVTMEIICNPSINSTLHTLIKQISLYFKLDRRGLITQEENRTFKNKTK